MSTPDDFFDPKTGLLVNKLARKIAKGLAIGPDGDIWLYEGGVFRPAPGEVTRRMVTRLGDRYRNSQVKSVEDVLNAFGLPVLDDGPKPGEWHPWINLQNGMYNWQTKTLHPHDPSYRSTIQLPIEFDAAATCPAYTKWLNEVIEWDAVDLVLEAKGYMLMTGNPLQKAFLLHGPEGTGKSTDLRILEALLGRENITSQSLRALTENRFAPASLFGKQANILGDIDASYMKESSLFLSITGGDTFTAERKYRDGFEFRPFAKMIFSANKTWQSANDTGAYFRRWVILPFMRKLDRTQKFDESILHAELSGIFNLAMNALRELHGRGEFDVSGSAREAREEFETDSDPLRFWLANDPMLSVDRGNESLRANRTTVHARYMTWSEQNGYKYGKSAGDFYKSLKALGYEFRASNSQRYVLGIDVYAPGTVPA
ncbi:phage/plasmid primase, P4 family [Microbacterium sp. KSW4-17]|uniref:Phage/plasmid primase, P4 family n=1 Tax=Microbacterium galbum TaxID=3075994 RepID=A0ABU3T8H9_9MICO|nr:phage/plasmid primase, P4 family [Microbacterium sp. KSW4-17]MDU0367668.1 phage/plasmid primase, P4 family [Microbacterium sp. KSW4-17]